MVEDRELDLLDKFQRGRLRQLQSLPESIVIPAIYMLLSIILLQAQIHQKILSLFKNILHRPASSEYEVLMRQLAMKDTSGPANSSKCYTSTTCHLR